MFCENCGTKNDSANKFCEKCGKELKQETSKKVDLKSFDYKGFYEKNKIACLAGAAVIVVVILLLVFSGSTPESVTKDFFKAVENGDSKKIVEILDFSKYEDKYDLDEEDIEEYAEDLIDDMEDVDFEYTILSSKVKTNTATVKVKIKSDDNSAKRTIYLTKRSGSWKIDPKKTFGSVY